VKYKYKKLYRNRKKKSRLIFLALKSRFFWLFFLLLIVIGALFYFLVFSSFLQIKEIKISGNEKIVTNDIENTIFDHLNRKIIFFDTKSILLADLRKADESLLKNFPLIFQVELKRKLFNTLLVNIKERERVAVFCQANQSSPSTEGLDLGGQDNSCFSIDNEGVIFKENSEEDSVLKIEKTDRVDNLILGKMVVEKGKMTKILKIKSELKNDFKILIKEALISGDRLNVKTSEDWEIYFNLSKDLNWQITELEAILKEDITLAKRKNLKYIDLRFDKIFIFPETY